MRENLRKAALLFTIGLSSCHCWDPVGQGPYFEKQEDQIWVVKNSYQARGEPRNPDSRMVVVEFDEEGQQQVSPSQKQLLSKQINSFEPKTLIVYIHGWHNNADDKKIRYYSGKKEPTHDLWDFDSVLEEMGRADVGRTLGVYIGWRGESCNDRIGRWLTLDDRREAARGIGNSTEFQDFLSDTVDLGHRIKDCRVVVVGHSLGAVVLEHSMKGMIESKIPESSLPEMFLLLNSASTSSESSVIFDQINSSWRASQMDSGTKVITPRVVSLTSEADCAVKCALPLNGVIRGRGFSDRAPGFDDELIGHQLRLASSSDSSLKAAALFSESFKPRLDPKIWVQDDESGRTDIYRVHFKGERPKESYLWNLRVPAAVASHHNDVYNGRMQAVALSFLCMADPQSFGLPDDMYEIEKAIRRRSQPQMGDFVNGAAFRIPHNPTTIGFLLDRLEVSDEVSLLKKSPRETYKSNLCAILKFSCMSESAWSAKLKQRATSVFLENPKLIDIMLSAGPDEIRRDEMGARFLDFLGIDTRNNPNRHP
ncbi:MAG: hypothetical protein AAGI48_13595 [Verrucomicrobiota bacterium]